MGERIRILDRGYLKLIESWGSDERIIGRARMSTGKEFVSWEPYKGHPRGDVGLLKNMMHADPPHTSPFEFAGMTIEVECPAVVVWQWVRHRTLSYSILSGRYAEMPDYDYLPTVERIMRDPGSNKQAGPAKWADALTAESAAEWVGQLRLTYAAMQATYRAGLKGGIPKELARLCLGFGRYTRMSVSGNLWNWLKFTRLRNHGDAQGEIRDYADVVCGVVATTFPRTWEAFSTR